MVLMEKELFFIFIKILLFSRACRAIHLQLLRSFSPHCGSLVQMIFVYHCLDFVNELRPFPSALLFHRWEEIESFIKKNWIWVLVMLKFGTMLLIHTKKDQILVWNPGFLTSHVWNKLPFLEFGHYGKPWFIRIRKEDAFRLFPLHSWGAHEPKAYCGLFSWWNKNHVWSGQGVCACALLCLCVFP